MPSTAPSIAFSLSSISIIYYILGDVAFTLIWGVLSCEVIKQLLSIGTSTISSNKRVVQAERDATAQAIAESVAAELEAKTDAEIQRLSIARAEIEAKTDLEIERLNIARAESEQKRRAFVDATAKQIIEDIIATQERERAEQAARELAEQEARERKEQEALERAECEARELAEREVCEAVEAEANALAALRNVIPKFLHNLDPLDSDFTCVGTTQKGYRCGQWMLSDACKSAGDRQLKCMLSDDPGSSFTLKELRKLAYNLLCPRWHQKSQYEQIGQRWFNQLAEAREALDKLEQARARRVELQSSQEESEAEVSESDEASDTESTRTLSRPSSRSSTPSISAMSTPEAPRRFRRRRSSSINSDETPSLTGDEEPKR